MLLRWFLGFSLALGSAALKDVLAQKKSNIIFDDDDNESGAAASSIHDDATPVSEVDTTVTNGFDGAYADETIIPEKPAEPAVNSEMQTRAQVQPGRVEEQWPTNHGMHVMSVPDGPEMPHKVNSLVATSSMVEAAHPNLGPLKTQAQLNGEVAEEYDDADVEGDKTGLPSADEHVSASDGEPMTYEDVHRHKHGDVDKIVALKRKRVKHADPPEYHPPPPASQAPTIRVIPGGPFVPGSYIGGSKRNLRVGTVKRKDATARMKDQCVAYTNFLKAAQGPVAPPMGPKILQMMKGTCDGAIRAGEASSQYTLMCNSLGSAVEPFLVSPATDWGGICDAVIKVFHESGVGNL